MAYARFYTLRQSLIACAIIFLITGFCFASLTLLAEYGFQEQRVRVVIDDFIIDYVQAPDWNVTEYGFRITRSDGSVAHEGWSYVYADTCTFLRLEEQAERIYFHCVNTNITEETPFVDRITQTLYVSGVKKEGIALQKLLYTSVKQ